MLYVQTTSTTGCLPHLPEFLCSGQVLLVQMRLCFPLALQNHLLGALQLSSYAVGFGWHNYVRGGTPDHQNYSSRNLQCITKHDQVPFNKSIQRQVYFCYFYVGWLSGVGLGFFVVLVFLLFCCCCCFAQVTNMLCVLNCNFTLTT